jgi:hypothetical protein
MNDGHESPDPLPPLPELPSTVQPPPQTPRAWPPPKNPGFALVLSLFPGCGQFYNGEPAKALAFFFGWVGCIFLAREEPFPFGLMIPFVYLINLVDAWRSAGRVNSRRMGLTLEELKADERGESPAWGAGLVGMGLLLLLNNLGWLELRAFARLWPLLLMAAGGAFIWTALRQRQGARRDL